MHCRSELPGEKVHPVAAHCTCSGGVLVATRKEMLQFAVGTLHCTSRLPGCSTLPARPLALHAYDLRVEAALKASEVEQVAPGPPPAAQAAAEVHSAQLGPVKPSGHAVPAAVASMCEEAREQGGRPGRGVNQRPGASGSARALTVALLRARASSEQQQCRKRGHAESPHCLEQAQSGSAAVGDAPSKLACFRESNMWEKGYARGLLGPAAAGARALSKQK